ncbi:hypothetical protein [Microbispora catharanthi]|uniref:Uncharacterized protein n=1 Tax=Microbispora catharanthi TaxID=1712871 RepID=A0A5N6BRL6_9ACTN|nr:hypothetical protein [Microbispora catharanthi]KAB8183095.1 hypothetical protein FH610_021440 [Microbispora catharanthi]
MNLRERWNLHVARAMEQDRLVALHRTRRRRRLLVVAGAASVLLLWADAAVSWAIAPSDTAVRVNLVLLVVMLAIYIPVVTALNSATRGLASLPESRLDERQVAERLRAHTYANRVMRLILAGLAVFVVVATWSEADKSQIPAAAVFLGVFALWWTHFLLPLLVAGWRLPDPPPDDDQDDEQDDEQSDDQAGAA